MDAIRLIQRRYAGRGLAAAAVLGAGLYASGWPSPAGGLMLGGIFSVLQFTLLGKSISRRATRDHRAGKRLSFLAPIGRYLLWALPVVVAVRVPAIDLPATVAGLFLVPCCILLDAVIHQVRGGPSPFT